MTQQDNLRILLIDDNAAIHEDFRKILAPEGDADSGLSDMRSAFLGGGTEETAASSSTARTYELHSAFQGEQGYELLCSAFDAGNPFAMAFVDMRMPPGWDGVETIAKLWEKDPDLQVVVCTAFSDYTWEETVEELGQSDRLLILKKPFDSIEISQLAAALTTKWNMAVREKALFLEAKRSENEARAYASSLETVNRALVTSKAAADMALEMRTEFLVQVSNEVNLRLNEVLGNVGALSQAAAGMQLSSELETALETSQRLLHTIDEVLDVTALERGRSTIQHSPFSPRSLAEEVIAKYSKSATDKGVELTLVADNQIPDEIVSEPVRVRQILDSLVENALRCTASGSVKVCLGTGRSEDWQRPKFVFEVVDTGAGISKERLGVIFEPCSREGEAGSGTGFGFGLSLARRMSALLGGEIRARSEPDQGSTFTLTLEYASVNASGQAA